MLRLDGGKGRETLPIRTRGRKDVLPLLGRSQFFAHETIRHFFLLICPSVAHRYFYGTWYLFLTKDTYRS